MNRQDKEFKALLDGYTKGAPEAGYTSEIGNRLVQLLSMAKSYQGLAVAGCNRELTQRELNRQERLEKGMQIHADNLPGVKGLITGGDPRGSVVKLQMVSGYTNDFGQTGICVY